MMKNKGSMTSFLISPTPPPPLPDFHIVEEGLTFAKKGEKKHFTVQNRHAQFKMVNPIGNFLETMLID